ncbi:ABC transporter substrate-binding protein [Castellaniella sp. GW247-6E4]|uniref:ABC transporter substrate-binding protein n=1 Tax=Castellaniella sp. GW247-6E4 TaxID=3140380 RepID=UPI0033158D4B
MMQRRQILAMVVGSAIAGLAAGAGAQDVIKIGAIAPLTGNFAPVGQSQLNGLELRTEEINKENGKYKIKLIVHDDASKCNESVNATIEVLTKDKVTAVFGATNSPCALAMIPSTSRYKVPQFTYGVGTALTEQGSKWIFRIAVGAPGQSRALANYAVHDLKQDKIAVLYSDDEYGASMANGFKKALQDLKLEPAAFESFPISDQDFTGQLTKVKESGATALFATGVYTAVALIAKQAKQMGMNLQLLGDTGTATPKFAELGGKDVEGTILVVPFDPDSTAPKVRSFVQKYNAKFGRNPGGWEAEVYDALSMIYEAVNKSGENTPEAVRKYVSGLTPEHPYVGVLGEWKFDQKGNADFPLYMVKIEGGKQVVVSK